MMKSAWIVDRFSLAPEVGLRCAPRRKPRARPKRVRGMLRPPATSLHGIAARTSFLANHCGDRDMRCAAVLAAALTTSISVIPSMLMAQAAQPTGDVRPIPISTASRTTGMLRIDGRLDESDWAQAAPTDSFTQIDPDEGKPATQPTEVRVLYNGEFLYVGARLRDSGAMRARLGRRDMDPGDSDCFKVLIDSYHDHRTAFGFEINPLGVKRDEIRTIDTDDNTWDPVWDAATS